jgi:hypothetical protein
MTVSRKLQMWLWIFLVGITGCRRGKQVALPPVSEAPPSVYEGPSTELENQSTSTPIAIDTLPKPTSASTEVKPDLPLPATRPPIPKPPKISLQPKKDVKPAVVVQAPAIQLAPRVSESERNILTKKISDHLESAKSLIKSVNQAHLSEEQRTNLTAIQDFIRKSEDAIKRGEFTQSLVLAEKADTLAASISNQP